MDRPSGRPAGIRIIATLLLVGAVLGVVSLVDGLPPWVATLAPTMAPDDATRPVAIAWAAACIVAAVLLLLSRRSGWGLAMVVTGTALLVELIHWWNGAPDHVSMAVGVVTAFYLNTTAVRGYLLGSAPRAVTIVQGDGE